MKVSKWTKPPKSSLERTFGCIPRNNKKWLAEHDKRIISDVIDYVFSELNRLHISYDSEENSVRTTYYDGTDDETTVDIVKGILNENFAKEIKEQNND